MIKATEKNRKTIITMSLVLIVIGLTVIPFIIAKNAQFNGSDGKAKSAITEVSPGYKPWFTSIWKPPSAEMESFLFALQAAIGAGIIGYGLGYLKGKSKRDKGNDKELK